MLYNGSCPDVSSGWKKSNQLMSKGFSCKAEFIMGSGTYSLVMLGTAASDDPIMFCGTSSGAVRLFWRLQWDGAVKTASANGLR